MFILLDFLRSQHDPNKTCSSKYFSCVSAISHLWLSKRKTITHVISFSLFLLVIAWLWFLVKTCQRNFCQTKMFPDSIPVTLFIFHIYFTFMNWNTNLNWLIFGPHKENTFLEYFPPGNFFLVVSSLAYQLCCLSQLHSLYENYLKCSPLKAV